MRRRRRRREYTPAQELARTQLDRAELWVQIVSAGIGKAFENARYCHDGMRAVINEVNTSLVAAVEALGLAQTAHDLAFDRPGRAASTVIVSGRPGKNPPRKGKKQSVPSLKPKQKRSK